MIAVEERYPGCLTLLMGEQNQIYEDITIRTHGAHSPWKNRKQVDQGLSGRTDSWEIIRTCSWTKRDTGAVVAD